jgi:hypothetical protein
VRGRRLRIAAIGLHLGSVDQVGEFDRVLDKEHRDVVADEVPIALARVELHRETAHVARRVDRARAAGDGREAGEHLGALSLLLEQVGDGDVGKALGAFEIAVRRRAAGVDDPLGDALVIEVVDLLAINLVFEQHRTARARLELVLVVGDRRAVVGGQHRMIGIGALMRLTAVAGVQGQGIGHEGISHRGGLRSLNEADLGQCLRAANFRSGWRETRSATRPRWRGLSHMNIRLSPLPSNPAPSPRTCSGVTDERRTPIEPHPCSHMR